MSNRYYRDHNHYYEDEHSRHLPRRNNIATIRLLTEGAESIIEHGQRYRQHQRDQHNLDETSPAPHGEEWSVRASSFIGIFPLLRNVFLFGLFAVLLTLVSLGEYGLFYTLAMPGLHSNNILHFDYTSMGIENQLIRQISPDAFGSTGRSTERTTTNSTVCDGEDGDYNDSCGRDMNTAQKSRNLFREDTSSVHPSQNQRVRQQYQVLLQSAPVAVVDLFSNHNSWQHHQPDIVPQPKGGKRILRRGTPHFIEIVLDLPESKTNTEKIGIFSVVVDLESSSSGISTTNTSNDTTTATTTTTTTTKLLASSTRTARMPHESFWISVVRKALCIIPHVLGAIPESRRVIVPSYRFFVESEKFPLRYVTVRLLVSPEKAQRGDIVEVIHGMLRIGEELTGMQLVLKEWLFTCMTIGTLVFFSLQCVFFFAIHVCWSQRCQRRQEREQERIILEDDVSESLGLNGFDGSNDDNSERRSSQEQRQNNSSFDYVEDDEDEWEDLSEIDSQNEDQDYDRETVGENLAPTPFSPSAQSEDESHHLIPDN